MSRRTIDIITVVVLLVLSFSMLLARVLVAGRLWNVGYDILFWDEAGKGYVSLPVAMVSYAVGAAAGISCVYGATRKLVGRRWVWIAMLPISVLPTLGLRHQPSDSCRQQVVNSGQRIIEALESYNEDRGRYPANLNQLTPTYLSALPSNGLVKSRRFYYTSKEDKADDRGPWFSGAKKLIGKDEYVIAVPFVPGGTVIYRPTGDYADIEGTSIGGGWFHTNID
ncbi:MAG: hypothetical protein HYX78_06860 [Armatimonadetes bacterium]|nr:hypothetical protein [Armatimonadota bacterium]